MSSRILIVGGGALGAVMAARLTRHGHEVVVLDANREHAKLMRDPGLEVDLVGEKVVVPLETATNAGELHGEFKFGLVTLKAPHIQAALEPLVERGLVRNFVSLGNGLVQDRVQQVVGEGNMLIGTVSWGATNLGPGRVAQTTIAPFALGEPDGSMTKRLEQLGQVLSDVAQVHFTDNIQGQIWAKLLLNSTFSGLGVVTGLVYGDVMRLPQGPEVAMAIWTEGFRVAMSMSIDLDTVAGIEPRDIAVLSSQDRQVSSVAITQLMASLGPTKASMLQDVEKGFVTEVDVINGGVALAGRKIGEPTPLNDAVVAIVRGYESGSGAPNPNAILDLLPIAQSELP